MAEILVLLPGDGGVLLPAVERAPASRQVVVDQGCPTCSVAPLVVEGEVPHVVRSDNHERCTEWEARAICCGADGFTIGVKVTSLFGFDEDRAVLQGRPRVY